MEDRYQNFLLGMFILGAMILAVVVSFLLLSTNFFAKTEKYIMYFNNSVSGLGPGAPVNFLGVKVGQVTEVSLIVNSTEDGSAHSQAAVLVDIDAKLIKYDGQNNGNKNPIIIFINNGLKGRLHNQSFITGRLEVDLVFTPKVHSVFYNNIEQYPYKEIPTQASELSMFAKKLDKFPFEQIGEGLNNLLDKFNTAMIKGDVEGTLQNLSIIAKKLDHILYNMEGTLNNKSELMININEALMSIVNASNSVNDAANTIERNPNSIIFGKR
tara:strand:- start:9953 stop:10759 length:807 start_codon:yes stop_codon:yes gene_type:complete